MAKWKLFGKSKKIEYEQPLQQEPVQAEPSESSENIQTETEVTLQPTVEETTQTENKQEPVQVESSRSEENLQTETEVTLQPTVEETLQIENKQEPENQNLAEYHETLRTEGSTSKKDSLSKPESDSSSDQRFWRDVNSIEKNVDDLHIAKSTKPVSELDKTVDKLLKKKDKK